jgi:hypothetical protein
LRGQAVVEIGDRAPELVGSSKEGVCLANDGVSSLRLSTELEGVGHEEKYPPQIVA